MIIAINLKTRKSTICEINNIDEKSNTQRIVMEERVNNNLTEKNQKHIFANF